MRKRIVATIVAIAPRKTPNASHVHKLDGATPFTNHQTQPQKAATSHALGMRIDEKVCAGRYKIQPSEATIPKAVAGRVGSRFCESIAANLPILKIKTLVKVSNAT